VVEAMVSDLVTGIAAVVVVLVVTDVFAGGVFGCIMFS
jgi:hypothetical protein